MKRLQCNELKSVFLSSYTPMFNLPLLPLIPLSVFNFHLFHSFILSPCLQPVYLFLASLSLRMPRSSYLPHSTATLQSDLARCHWLLRGGLSRNLGGGVPLFMSNYQAALTHRAGRMPRLRSSHSITQLGPRGRVTLPERPWQQARPPAAGSARACMCVFAMQSSPKSKVFSEGLKLLSDLNLSK